MLKLQHKLLLAFLVFIIMPLIALGSVSYQISTKVILDKVSEQTLQTLKSTDLNVRTAIKEIDSFSDLVITSFDVQNLLHSDMNSRSISYFEYDRFYQAAKKLLYSNTEVVGFSLYSLDNLVLNMGESSSLSLHELKSEAYFNDVVNLGGKPLWLGPYENASLSLDHASLLTQIRVIKDYYSLEDIGYLVMYVKGDLLERIFFELYQQETGDMMIINEQGTIMYSQNVPALAGESFLPKMTNQLSQHRSGSDIAVWQGDRSLITYYKSSIGWIFVSVKPWNVLLDETKYIRNASIILVVFALILAGWFNWYYIRRIVRFISQFSQSMQKVKLGSLSHKIHESGQDELGKLAQSYNRMLDQIRQLLHDVKLEQQRKKEAEFNVLQAQINPHFLYNTLESINALASMSGNKEIQQMTQSLGQLLRISIRSHVMLYVREEVNHVQSYLEIQKMRYSDLFEYEIEVEEGLQQAKTLKLILQPLVENAIYHGFEDKEEGGFIHIKICKEQDTLCFYVFDNGEGISADVLEVWNGKSNKGETKSLGHGMKNVHDRITMYFGPKYGLCICSSPGWGTMIKIRIPANGGEGYALQSASG